MKLKEKILSALTLTVASASAISVINKIIFAKSESHVYSSRFPTIFHSHTTGVSDNPI